MLPSAPKWITSGILHSQWRDQSISSFVFICLRLAQSCEIKDVDHDLKVTFLLHTAIKASKGCRT